MRIYKFSKSAILHHVRKGPVKLLELAQGSRNPGVRKRLMRHINALEQAGTIKKVWIQGFPHYVKSLHETTDDDRVRMLRENCRPSDGCMAWASHVDPQRELGRQRGAVEERVGGVGVELRVGHGRLRRAGRTSARHAPARASHRRGWAASSADVTAQKDTRRS